MRDKKEIIKCDVCGKEVSELSKIEPIKTGTSDFADICKTCGDKISNALFPKPRKPRAKKPKVVEATI